MSSTFKPDYRKRGWYLDHPGYVPEAAERFIRFCNTQLRVPKGPYAKQPLTPLPWMLDVIRPFYGILKPNGARQYRRIWIEIPKKNKKSTGIGLAVALYSLYADGIFVNGQTIKEEGAEIYVVASDKTQAAVIFDACDRNWEWNKRFRKASRRQRSWKQIHYLKQGSKLKVLPSMPDPDRKHGLSPTALIFDEMHAWHTKNQLLSHKWLTRGTKIGRKQQTILYMTTAGTRRESPLAWDLHLKAERILKGEHDDPTFLPLIFSIKDGQDWQDPKVWVQVNPGHDEDDQEEIHDWYRDAMDGDEQDQLDFKRLALGLWADAAGGAIKEAKWDACAGKLSSSEIVAANVNRQVFAGINVSSIKGLAALVLLFPPKEEGGIFEIGCYFWIPEQNADDLKLKDLNDYPAWKRSGALQYTSGNVTDYATIKAKVREIRDNFDLVLAAYNPREATQMATELLEDDGVPMLKVPRGFSTQSEPTKRVLALIESKRFDHGRHPALRSSAQNLYVKGPGLMDGVDPVEHDGDIEPDIKASVGPIVGITALIDAMAAYLKHHEGSEWSVYETHRPIVGDI